MHRQITFALILILLVGLSSALQAQIWRTNNSGDGAGIDIDNVAGLPDNVIYDQPAMSKQDDNVQVQVNESSDADFGADNYSWVGLTVHGGMLSDYDNLSVEQSIKDAYNDLGDFSLSGEMKDIGAQLNFRRSENFAFDLSGDYAWKTRKIKDRFDLRYSVMSASASGRFIIPLVISPYVGAGVGAFRTAQSITKHDDVTVVLPDDKTNFGWLVKGGVALDVPRFPLMPFLEWRYSNVASGDEEDDIKYHSVVLGGTIKFQ
jgi:opacity protein-like surface antigen